MCLEFRHHGSRVASAHPQQALGRTECPNKRKTLQSLLASSFQVEQALTLLEELEHCCGHVLHERSAEADSDKMQQPGLLLLRILIRMPIT